MVTCYRRRDGPAAPWSSSQSNQPLKSLIVVEGLHFSAVELDQGLLKLGSLGATCFSLNSSASKLRSFSSSNAISFSSCFVRFSDSSARILDSAILLSTSGSRRQLSIDNHNRKRGNDAPDAPLLVEGEPMGAEGDVVIRGIQGNQANHQAAQELNPGRTVESEEAELSMHQV
jgi:hypothetical protein